MKPGIPAVRTGQVDLDQALSAVKQTLDAMTGQARNVKPLSPLPAAATLVQVIAQLNQLLDRIQ